MQISATRYVIAVPDLLRSASYYQRVLGFDVSELGDPGWRVYSSGACVIMAGHCPDAQSPDTLGDHSYFAYLTVEGTAALDAFHAEVVARGGKIVKPPRDEPWGMREFGLRTIDGHRIMFGAAVAESGSPST